MSQATDKNGTITVAGDLATLTFVRRLHDPIDRVWSALTDPAERQTWFGSTSLEPYEGGTIELDPDDPPVKPELKHMRGRILRWDPPRLLEHTWHQTIVGDGVVRYELAPDGDDTILTFSHRGLSVSNAKGFIPGTHAYFDRLEAHLAGHPIPAWSERYAELAPTYA